MHFKLTLAAAALAVSTGAAHAADWSDTSLSVRYGTTFAEPFDNNYATDGSKKDIKKGIIALTHASGDKYGTNFFNADVLLSNYQDPGVDTKSGAQEVYLVYRRLMDIGKISGSPIKFGPVRGVGVTGGFDLNTKNDSYGSKKRMLVLGPTLMFDVTGFLNASALILSESNAPENLPCGCRYTYKAHGALELDWSLPIPGVPLSFNGYALYIGSKGKNEFGGPTAPETHIDMTLMYDAGVLAGAAKGTFMVGVEYEYWRNKFGNPTTSGASALADGTPGPGATASTPMIRAEYHF